MRYLASIFTFLLVLTNESGFAADTPKQLSPAEQFVHDLGNNIITLIRSTDDMSQKKEHFRGILQQNFDMKTIGKFVLSQFWRQANDTQKKEFLKLFEQNMVDTYTSQFNQYKDETMSVMNSHEDPKDGALWVNAKVQGPAREPLNIRWKLYNKGGHFMVYDIHVNEASMCITHRSEYASIIGKHGGKIDGLLADMRTNKEKRKDN
jgi:phospholipid transport system substrate-binding protein